MAATEALTLRIAPELKKDFNARASELGETMNGLAVLVLTRFCNQDEDGLRTLMQYSVKNTH